MNGIHPNTGASAVDENRLTRFLFQFCHLKEGLVRSQADHKYTGCFDRGEGIRSFDDFLRLDRDLLSEGASAIGYVNIRCKETCDFVIGRKSCGGISIHDLSGKLEFCVSLQERVGEEGHQMVNSVEIIEIISELCSSGVNIERNIHIVE